MAQLVYVKGHVNVFFIAKKGVQHIAELAGDKSLICQLVAGPDAPEYRRAIPSNADPPAPVYVDLKLSFLQFAPLGRNDLLIVQIFNFAAFNCREKAVNPAGSDLNASF